VSAVESGYVRSGNTWLVQVSDQDSRWGFYLASDDQTWDGGFGALPNGAEWEAVSLDEVPPEVQERLSWILDEVGAWL
jgi:hypothetical protein